MSKKYKLNASMTVEAAFVLPFFLFAFLNLISIIEIYRLQSNMSAAMHSTAKEMASHGCEYEALGGGNVGTAEAAGLTVYASNRIKNILGNEYLETSPILEGFSSISWLHSSVMGKDDCIDLVAIYKVKPSIAIIGFDDFYMYNRIRTRAWTGYDNANAGLSGDNSEEIVYITPEGEVYHRSRGCTYIKLSIAAVDLSFLENERNASGAKYYPCESCGYTEKSTVFITNYGNRYHSTLRCSGLKRTVMAVPISQTGGRRECSKCGG